MTPKPRDNAFWRFLDRRSDRQRSIRLLSISLALIVVAIAMRVFTWAFLDGDANPHGLLTLMIGAAVGTVIGMGIHLARPR